MYFDESFEEYINMNITNHIIQNQYYISQNYPFKENKINSDYPIGRYIDTEKDEMKNQCNSIISFDEKSEEVEFDITKKNNDFDDDESEIENLFFLEDKDKVITPIPKFENEQSKSDGKNKNIVKTKSTEFKTNGIIIEKQKIVEIQNLDSNSKKKKKFKKLEKKILFNNNKIFYISKVNRKVGRLEKKSKKLLKGKHNKFYYDNIITKIKTSFHNNISNYINKKYEIYLKSINQKNMTKLLQKISNKEYRKIKKDDNLKWFSSKLKDVFSANLSLRCSLYLPDYNKRQIDKLYKEAKIPDLIDIFEKTIREMYEIYVNDIKLDGFKTLEDELKNLQNKMEKEGEEDIEGYIKEYKYVAHNLEQIFINKRGRNKNLSKKMKIK